MSAPSGAVAYLVCQMVMSLALLVFAALAPGTEHIADLVVGAVIANWLREGVYLGRTLSAQQGPGKGDGNGTTQP